MKIIVQKFGGTSLKDEHVRERAIAHIRNAKQEGYGVVVVVSAMGRKGEPYATDTFLDWIGQNGDQLSVREKDLLLSCGEMISSTTLSSLLNAKHIPSVVLTGYQAGIITNSDFGNARIISINPKRIKEKLKQNNVVVVCGFQGGTTDGEITTLGRGGSDTTATALGRALKAKYVDIFTDVEGIMTADPRVVEDASPLKRMTYTEISNLAYQGAKVIHPRAVEIAMQGQVPIRVRSTMSDDEGTLVTSLGDSDYIERRFNDRLVTGIAHVADIAQIEVIRTNGQDKDLHLNVFKAMAENQISVDFISISPSSVTYTVAEHSVEQTKSILQSIGYQPQVRHDCAKVSTIGAGMAGVPGVVSKIIEALTEENIGILQSADSHTTIWVLVQRKDLSRAVKALHRKFDLHKKELL